MRYFVVPSFRLFFQSILPLLFAMVAVSLQAQKLSVQGLLKKGDGTSLPDGNYTMKFNFYDTNGNFVAAVTTNDVPVSGGVYSALLDASSATPSNALNFSTEYLVGLVVNGGTELTPRITMSAAPYALALNGSSNKFPSFGTVKADAMDVVGAITAASVTATGEVKGATVTSTGAVNAASVAATGDVTASRALTNTGNFGGYVFKGATGSDDGVISPANNEVSIYTNGSERLKVSNTSTTISGDHTVNGNQTVSGLSKANMFRARGGTPGVSGGNLNGYAFEGNNGDNDSGLFSLGDNNVSLYANGVQIFSGDGSGFNVLTGLYLHDVPNSYDGDNLEWRGRPGGWNPSSFRVGINTSSRRYKTNIKPFATDFTKILQLQPKIYNRKDNDPNIFEIGYIAEEADSLGMKNLVLYDEQNRPNSLIYKKFIIYTNEVVKIHQADIENMKKEIEILKAEKNALRTENAQLRADAQKRAADMDKQMTEINRRLRSLEVAASNRK